MKVQINIRGRVYHIRTEDDPQRVQEIADNLNERLNALAPNGNTLMNMQFGHYCIIYIGRGKAE